MREKIIKYLQEIKCEWFPVEWDRFLADYIEIVEGCDHEGMDVRYRFEEHYLSVSYSGDIENTMFYYGPLDRCKTLLLNAVRSKVQGERLRAGWQPEQFSIKTDSTGNVWIEAFRIGGGWERKVWQNGEFK